MTDEMQLYMKYLTQKTVCSQHPWYKGHKVMRLKCSKKDPGKKQEKHPKNQDT